MESEGHAEAKRPKLDHTADAPRELKVIKLAQSHAKEIRALTQVVANTGKNRNASQAVPVYMRRRAASHNANRLPRRIRQAIAKSIPEKRKRPSRYYRRRPKNLKDDYAQRQRRVHWLETHIWHAKRFHMVEKWGYKIPHYPTEKGQRSGYRAATANCLIQDQSYIVCVEVLAPHQLIADCITSIVSVDELKAKSVKDYMKGLEALYCTLYQPNSYPSAPICPAEILFNPRGGQAWIWCHTLAVSSVFSALCQFFNAPQQEGKDSVTFKTSDGSSVLLRNLSGFLVRFTLHGRKTCETLTRVITPIKTNSAAVGPHVWWGEEFASCKGEITDDLKTSLKQWYRTDGNVATVRARDPRLCMQHIIKLMKDRKEKKEQEHYHSDEEQWGPESLWNGVAGVQEEQLGSDNGINGGGGAELSLNIRKKLTNELMPAHSPLWDEDVRNKVSKHFLSQHQLNQKRAQLLVPGSELSLGEQESCLPLLLILHKHKATLILPGGWSMAFWTAFLYAGARPGGIREDKMVSLCTRNLHFPSDYPDTQLQQQEELMQAKCLREKHFKYPPGKRPNFDKLRTNSPFRCGWGYLLSDEAPVVLRDRKLLAKWDSLLQQTQPTSQRADLPEKLSAVNLAQVTIHMLKRGVPEERAEICLPEFSDIEDLSAGSDSGPVVLSYREESKRSEETHCTLSSHRITSTKEIIGYVTAGMYSLGLGSGVGRGFVHLQKLRQCLEREDLRLKGRNNKNGLLCLIRACDSRQYRFALLSIGDSE